MLMKKYNVDIDHVIRHFDVNGKHCPKPFMTDVKAWEAFKKRLEEYEVEKLTIKVDGEKHEVNRVLVGQNNFIKIRDIAPLLGYDVDSVKGVVTLTKK
jgi:N-acetylmuramoyl-L-alanine amidase CwlA